MAARVPPSVDVAARSATAGAGGWLLAAAASGLAARWLPVARVDATAWGLVLSFALYVAVLLWCFAEPRLPRVLAAVWGAGAALAALLLAGGARP